MALKGDLCLSILELLFVEFDPLISAALKKRVQLAVVIGCSLLFSVYTAED